MMVAWAIAINPGRSGWTDAIWSFATGVAAFVVSLYPFNETASPRATVVALLVAVWSLRLGLHISARNTKNADDPRYAELRLAWGRNFQARLFLFLQIQAAAGLLLVVSVMAAAHNPSFFPAWSDYFGAGLLAVGIVGESIADRQLTRFRRPGQNRGKVCTKGLWGLSRHPNYFFEWVGWVSYAVIALGPDFDFAERWYGLVGPVLMYVLLVHVSGIPPLEAHMVRSRGDAFRKVQDQVSAFWPIPRFW